MPLRARLPRHGDVLRFLAVIAALLWAQAGRADPVTDCQEYARIAGFQIAIAKGKKNGGYGDGCAGAEGSRWNDTSGVQFNWCLNAEPEERAGELSARRKLLLKCTARIGKQKRSGWDDKSCLTYSGGLICLYSPDAYGQGSCENQGQLILNAVKAVEGNPSILFDDAKDKHFYNSSYYHHFQHWKAFRCVLIQPPGEVRKYKLEGYTGAGVATKPSEDPIVAPGPIEETEVEEGPIAAPPPAQPELPYETKRRSGPLTQE